MPRTSVMIFSTGVLEAVREGGSRDERVSWGAFSDEEEYLCTALPEEEEQYLCTAPLEDSNSTVFGQADVSGFDTFSPSVFSNGCLRRGSYGGGSLSHEAHVSCPAFSDAELLLCTARREEGERCLCTGPLEDSNSSVFGEADASGLGPFFPSVCEGASHDERASLGLFCNAERPSWGAFSHEGHCPCPSPRDGGEQCLCRAPLEDSDSSCFGQADVLGLGPFFPPAPPHRGKRDGSCGDGAALRVPMRSWLAELDRPEKPEDEFAVARRAAPCTAAVTFNVGMPPEAVCDGRSPDELTGSVSDVSDDDDPQKGGSPVVPPRTAVMSFTPEMLNALRGKQSQDTRGSWTVFDGTNASSHRRGGAL